MVTINIESCIECNDLNIQQVYTADSFEFVRSLKCNKCGKVITHYLDTFDDYPSIPIWCPKRSSNLVLDTDDTKANRF